MKMISRLLLKAVLGLFILPIVWGIFYETTFALGIFGPILIGLIVITAVLVFLLAPSK